MINLFPLYDETTAPEAARDALVATKRNFGMIPNLERVNPTTLDCWWLAWPGGGAGRYRKKKICR